MPNLVEHPGRLVQFADFELDTLSGELRRGQSTLHLQPQVLKLLLTLLSRPGELVTRKELKQLLMPDATYGDFDHAINVTVSKLRAALRDSSDSPRFIQTLSRHGYRFLGKLRLEEGETGEPVRPPPLSRWRWSYIWGVSPGWVAVSAAVVAIVTVAIVLWWAGREARPSPASNTIRSLAVLPLTNLSPDPGQEYFADGMTDALITEISQIASLKVISRTSAMRYKGSNKPVPQIAKELGVDGVVEGAVLRSGDRVRISAQLIDARSDTHLWAKSFDGELRDVLSLQSELAMSIAQGVRAELTPDERTRMARPRTVNPKAYDLYWQGRHWWNQKNKKAMEKALDCFQRAIDADPNYAPAYAGLADALVVGGTYLYELIPTRDASLRCTAAAKTAVQLDESLAEGHASLAVCAYRFDLNYTQAESEFKRALKLNPNSALVRQRYSGLLFTQRRLDEALAQIVMSQELDPLYLQAGTSHGVILRCLGRLDEADEQFERVLRIDPGFAVAHGFRALLLEDEKRFPEAIDEWEHFFSLFETNPEMARTRAVQLRHAYARGGARGYWLQLLHFRKQDFQAGMWAPAWLAVVYAQLGDKEQALNWLNKGDCLQTPADALNERAFDPLRSDPRFQRVLRCLNLQP